MSLIETVTSLQQHLKSRPQTRLKILGKANRCPIECFDNSHPSPPIVFFQ